MVSEEAMKRQMEKEMREKIDRQWRAFYKAVRNMTRDSMDMGYSKEDMEDTRKIMHEHLDKYMSAELNDEEILFPVDKEFGKNHNDS